MRYSLQNSTMKIEIDSFGAELKSAVRLSDNTEFMWQADKQFWGRTSPVLFPFVGSLKNKAYTYKGNTYPMGQHGFARDMEHTLVSITEDEIWFTLHSTEETMAKYPFAFELYIGYRLEENCVTVQWKVTNPEEETMYFSIGAHPAFNCPIGGDADKYGYSLRFDGVSEIRHHGNDVPTGMALREDIVLPLTDHKAVITEGFFDRCTYMIEGNQTGCVGIVDKRGNEYVAVHFNTPLFAIWSPEGKNAPFVCIEPWYGRCDAEDFDGELKDREYTNVLNGGETFEASYSIEFAK